MLKNKYFLALILWLFALSLRWPATNYPKVAIFDEALHSTFALNFLHHRPFFDVHPPLVPILNSIIISGFKPDYHDIRENREFGNFPYLWLRISTIIAGSLLPVIIFYLGLAIYRQPNWAFLAGIFTAADNLLIMYSGMILPDIYMLIFGFWGLRFLLGKNNSIIKIISGSIFLALAAGVKWTGLAFAAVVTVEMIRNKQIFKVLLTLAIITAGQCLIWVTFFKNLNNKIPDFYFPLKSYYHQLIYPSANNLMEIGKYIPVHLADILKVNTIMKELTWASSPWQWLWGNGEITLTNPGNKQIIVGGNRFAWIFVLAGVLTTGVVLAMPEKKYLWKKIADPKYMQMMLWGYVISYVPLFFVGRALFIYHYLMPVIFGYLMLPGLIYALRKKGVMILILILAGFLIQVPQTYGW